MFTGIITDLGEIIECTPEAERGAAFRFASNWHFDERFVLGSSIAVDGVCLTVTAAGQANDRSWFSAWASRETLSKTLLGERSLGARVNLEHPLRVGDPLGGHWCLGHVDGCGRVIERRQDGKSLVLQIAPEDSDLIRLIAPKGSISVNGVSLTVNEVQSGEQGTVGPQVSILPSNFSVNLIPETQNRTNLSDVKTEDRVHLEIDPIARYVTHWLTLTGVEGRR